MTAATVNSEPKFSVLLPTHNRSDVLSFAIRSVLAQTVADFELLVVGDGCTDDTASVVQSFNDGRIRWFDLPKAPNFGYANRNVALRTARGAYIAFMAHDDLWLPDHLELVTPIIEQERVELAYTRPLWVISKGLLAPGTFNLEHAPTLESFLGGHNSIPAACVVHRRECFAKFGYWNESLPSGADMEMWARIIEGGGRKNFAYLSEPTALHFRANWRTEDTMGQTQLLVWKQLHALKDFMPAELRISVPNGMTEQEAVWRTMSAQPREWPNQIRSAVRQVLDQRVSQSDELMGAMLNVNPSLSMDVDKSHEQLAQFVPLLRLSQTSLDWKLTRLLLATKRRAFPVDTIRGRLWSRIIRGLS